MIYGRMIDEDRGRVFGVGVVDEDRERVLGGVVDEDREGVFGVV
jgi:hypothetical protein